MPDLSAERRLVKSPPELWAEVSEVERLAKHLGAFGEIRITKLEPERAVAWEGDHASGTVSIEASGWGTKVTLTAEVEAPPSAETPEDSPPEEFEPAPDEPAPDEPAEAPVEEEFERAEPEPEPGLPPEAARARSLDEIAPLVSRKPPGLFGRLFGGWLVQPDPAPQPEQPERLGDWLETALVDSAVAAHSGLDAGALVAPPSQPVSSPRPEPEPEPAPAPNVDEPEPSGDPEADGTLDPSAAQAILDSVLDTLGAAHHRPFSRG